MKAIVALHHCCAPAKRKTAVWIAVHRALQCVTLAAPVITENHCVAFILLSLPRQTEQKPNFML